MQNLIVHNQKELDSIPESFQGIIEIRKATEAMVVQGKYTVYVYDFSIVYASNNVEVYTFNTSQVSAWGDSKIYAFDNSKVNAYKNSIVDLHDDAKLNDYR